MNWYRIELTKAGTVAKCELVPDPTAFVVAADVLLIQATSEEDARRRSYNTYCGLRKKKAKARNHAAGRCACSRAQDRERPDGKGLFKTCSVCAERQVGYTEKYANRTSVKPRDEVKRVEVFQQRNRDRKGEIRLETLIEVRKVWENCRSNGAFTEWLRVEIKKGLLPVGEAAE